MKHNKHKLILIFSFKQFEDFASSNGREKIFCLLIWKCSISRLASGCFHKRRRSKLSTRMKTLPNREQCWNCLTLSVEVYLHFRVQQHTQLHTWAPHWEKNPPWVNLSAGFHVGADFQVVEGGEREERSERESKHVELKVENSRLQTWETQSRVCQSIATVEGGTRGHLQWENYPGATQLPYSLLNEIVRIMSAWTHYT